jgi:Flp pilus assembly protein protease CpaA
MRGITVTVVIAILALAGLTLRHSPSAAARHEQAPTVVSKPLPEQNTPYGLLGGPPYP